MSRLKSILCVSLLVMGVVLMTSSPAGAVPYTGVGPNSSIIGWATQGADYTTLIEAARAINKKGTLTGGDWIFYINNDLTSADIVIGATTFNNRIIFKPMPATNPTITFTQAGTTPAVLARIGIGINTSALALTSLTGPNFPQTKVTIDGSNVDGGNTRNMTIQTNNNAGNTKHMIRVFPGGDDVIIKNVRIIQTATATSGTCIASSVATAGNALVPGMSPDNGLVENCFLSHPNIGATANAAISSDRISGATVACTGWIYRGNDVRAGLRGFSLLASRGFRIEDNIIRVSATGTGALLTDAGIHCGMVAATNIGAATYAISGNIINCTKTISTLGEQHGIRIDDLNTGPNTVTIVNNAISIVNTQSAATQNPAWVTGIRIVKANTIASIHHNSIHVRSGSTYTAAANGQRACLNIPAGFTLGTASVLNNIFRINITSGYCVAYQMPVVNQGVVTSDYNMFFPVGALNLGRDNAADRLNLAAWIGNTPWDDNSSEGVDPSGVPGWNTLSDLRLSANVINAGWFANPIAGITKDIDGNTRGLVTVTKGCDENATAFSPTPTPTPAAPTPTSTPPPTWIPGGCAQGLFDGTGPGTSTIGACGDYENLSAAFDAVNAIGTLTGGDWTFLIQNDLSEPNDIVIAATTVWPLLPESNKIIIKPAVGVSPVVQFSNPSDFQNASGLTQHFNIGVNTNVTVPNAINIRKAIVVIDGSNSVGGTTRDMTIRGAHGSPKDIVRVIADTDNSVIKNTKIYNVGPLGVAFIATFLSTHAPDDVLIENNDFRVPTVFNGAGTTRNCFQTPSSGSVALQRWILRDNYILGSQFTMQLWTFANIRIEHNTIEAFNTLAAGTTNALQFASVAVVAGSTQTIVGNTIKSTKAHNAGGGAGSNGIETSADSVDTNYVVYNNSISTFYTATGASSDNRAIRAGRGTWYIYHNTINRRQSAATYDGAGNTDGIYIDNGVVAADVRNNLVRMGWSMPLATPASGTSGRCLNYDFTANLGKIISRSNLFYTNAQANVGRGSNNGAAIAIYQTLAAWQGITQAWDETVDGSAMAPVDPETLWLAPDDTRWAAGQTPVAAAWQGVPIARVTTDIDGQPRSLTAPLKGCDESDVLNIDEWTSY